MTTTFAVNWDYLCPFARNAHEHVLAGLGDGASWEVSFVPFSLVQNHVEDGGTSVWDEPEKAKGVLALQAGIVVRDRFGDRFPAVHRALFAARHDEGSDIGDPAVVEDVLEAHGVPASEVIAAIDDGWPLAELRQSHESWVSGYQVFGVPTFVAGGRAVFVRLMTRPGEDGRLARATIDNVVDLVAGHLEINELKQTTVPR